MYASIIPWRFRLQWFFLEFPLKWVLVLTPQINIQSQKCIISPSHYKCHNPTTLETFCLFIIFFNCSLFYIIFFNPHKEREMAQRNYNPFYSMNFLDFRAFFHYKLQLSKHCHLKISTLAKSQTKNPNQITQCFS
jgi:hypothetical protein